jgi:hypothetical protein
MSFAAADPVSAVWSHVDRTETTKGPLSRVSLVAASAVSSGTMISNDRAERRSARIRKEKKAHSLE